MSLSREALDIDTGEKRELNLHLGISRHTVHRYSLLGVCNWMFFWGLTKVLITERKEALKKQG